MSNTPRMVVVGQFAGTHGVRGGFKLRSFTEQPADIAAYGPVATEDGRKLTIKLVRELKPGLFLCSAPEITSPEEGDAYKGALLHVARELLPPPDEDEFYLDDLVGMTAVTPKGAPAGQVKAVVNYGAGDLVELSQVPGRKGAVLLPFTKEAVPEIDLAAGQLTVILPEEDDEMPPDDSG
ncbi:ribosome maturation factor RimM [Parvularcula marina]|uniref:ribosome maturation factor RimM n=1 Tax=Parvularcula marina TaxID=2292771 RepID=UPI0035164728